MEDYKQKYEQALKNINKIKTANKDNKELVDFIEFEYPELKDSRDERIRKELIEYLKTRLRTSFNQEVRICKDGIAYLEKQGEQKPVDKIEPKFKVGDWIVTNKNHIWYVDETPDTTSYLYRLINQYGKVEVAEFDIVDKKARLWTIQDAEDGDVLLAFDGSILIFAGVVGYACKYHIALISKNCVKFNKEVDTHSWVTSRGVHPAIKEQRDLLFQKMHEAGYEWDAEKKKLKKQKPAK